MLDVAEGEAAGTRVSRCGWRSFLMSCGTQSFKELQSKWSRSLLKAIKQQEMRAEDVHRRMTDKQQCVIVAKGLFSPVCGNVSCVAAMPT